MFYQAFFLLSISHTWLWFFHSQLLTTHVSFQLFLHFYFISTVHVTSLCSTVPFQTISHPSSNSRRLGQKGSHFFLLQWFPLSNVPLLLSQYICWLLLCVYITSILYVTIYIYHIHYIYVRHYICIYIYIYIYIRGAFNKFPGFFCTGI